MNSSKIAIAVGALIVSGTAAAEFSANIGATSNYVWRGVSQTDDAAAVSGGLDYAHEKGFYAGTWASNVDFDDDTTAEVDVYGGFANELDMGLGYDLGVIYYWYPGANDDLDFTEIYGSLSYGPVTGGINFTVDKEASGGNTNDVYYHLGAGFDVAETWSIGGTVGYYDFDGGGDYSHGQVDITKSAGSLGDFTLTVSSVLGQDDVSVDGDPLVFVSWAKTFD
jgi:uncharacterized protein (TIGR02001 family)